LTKIVLISPKGPLYRHRGGIFGRSLRYAPLTLTTLAALVPEQLGASIEIFDEGIEEIDLSLEADLIGMTVITGNAPRAYELAEHFRERGIAVVLGGPHITLLPEEAQRHADAIVTGYAEETWPQLLDDFSAGQMEPRYDQDPNLSLAGRPLPRRDLLRRFSYSTTQTFEATRGCIHHCEYCVVPTAWGTRPYQKPVQEVVEDIRQVEAKRPMFLDLNLIADPHYAADLFEALIPLRVKWFGLATVLLADDEELLPLAVRSGCRGLLVGFESLSEKNLRSFKKGFNDPGRFREVIDTFHSHNIALMGCFVFGVDHDTPEVFLETARFIVETKIDLPRLAILTPFPGTPLFQRLKAEDRILTEDWSLYDGQHVVFQPANMTVEELYDGTEMAWKYMYGIPSIWRRLAGSRREPLIALAANLGYRFYAHNLHKFYTCDVQL
jgi:radical SAM superfamily enzyme YgiQ (UPF0313 family)